MEAGSQYLLKVYSESNDTSQVDFEGFEQFIKTGDKKTQILHELVFDYILGYFLFKAGVRKCNSKYLFTGKNLLSPLFFAKNHPIYRKIYLYLDFDLAQQPEEIYRQFTKTVGLKIEDKGKMDGEAKYEHYDFVLEDVNKKIKTNLSWAPTDYMWLHACRTYDFIKRMAKNFNCYFNLTR